MTATETLPTLSELQALEAVWASPGYVGPMTLEVATSYCQHLAEQTHGAGDPMFPNVQLVREGAGYNLAYRNLPVQSWRPTGNPFLDDIIEIFMSGKDVNERGNDHYRGNTTRSAHAVGVKIKPNGFFEQPQWADYPYREVWTHPDLLAVVSYYEGTIVLVVCPDHDHYDAEVADAASTYGKPYRPGPTK